MACDGLVIAGGAVQIGGFTLALRQSVVTRREQSPDEASLMEWAGAASRRLWRRTSTWLRVKTEPLLTRLHLRRPRTASAAGAVSMGGRATVRGHKVINNQDQPLPERVTRLEAEVNDLHEKQSEQRADLEQRIHELKRGVDDRDARRDSEQAHHLGRMLRAQELGVLVFMVGVALTTVGAVA